MRVAGGCLLVAVACATAACHPAGQEPDAGAQDAGHPVIGGLAGVTTTTSGWVAVGGGTSAPLVLTSGDALVWRREELPSQAGSLWSVASANGTIVSVGPGGGANSMALVRTPDTLWHASLFGTNVEQVLAGNGVFLRGAGVEPGAATSFDGLTWAQTAVSTTMRFGFDGDQFVGVSPATSRFEVSADGQSWSTDGGLADPSFCQLVALAPVGDQILGFGTCAGGGLSQLLAARGNLAAASFSPVSWTDPAVTNWAASRVGIAASGSRVVVVTGSVIHVTQLPVSSAGWTDIPVGSLDWSLTDVTWGAGTFVAVGSKKGAALIATSVDGAVWQEVLLRE